MTKCVSSYFEFPARLKSAGLVAAAFGVVTGMTGPAHAEGWEYTAAPYIWGPYLKSSLEVGPNPPVNGDSSIFDILNGAFLIAGEARYDRWSVGGEFNYLNLGNDVAVGPVSNAASWELDGTMSTLAGGYALMSDDSGRLDAFAGLRHWDLKLTTTVFGRSAHADQSWTDPLIGLRYSKSLGDRWRVTTMGNVGGFGYGSEFQWEALAQVSWKWTDRLDVAGGYRHLKVGFDRSTDVVDLILTGPYVAVAFNF